MTWERMIDISIIIPVYNTEAYLGECIDSVIGQLTPKVECIFIDDGSADDSGRICEGLKQRISEDAIHVIHQKNQGLSGARNTGIKAANGKYVMFLDSDDMLHEKAIEKLLDYVKADEEMDIYFYDATIKNETSNYYDAMRYQRINRVESRTMSGMEYMTNWYFNPLIVSACLCLFRKEYLIKNNYWFTRGKYHEDVSYSFKTVLNAKRVQYIPENIYVRRYRTGSITTVPVSLRHYDGYVTAYGECLNEFRNLEKPMPALINIVNEYFRVSSENVLKLCSASNGDKERLADLVNQFISYQLEVDSKARGYSWYSTLQRNLRFMQKESLPMIKENQIRLKTWFKSDCIEDIINILIREREKYQKEMICKLPFDDKKLTIGIYGIGKHTKYILEAYKSYKTIQSRIYYIDGKQKTSTGSFEGQAVVNPESIFPETDMILISSFIHRGELLMRCRQIGILQNIKILDLYEIEKVALND